MIFTAFQTKASSGFFSGLVIILFIIAIILGFLFIIVKRLIASSNKKIVNRIEKLEEEIKKDKDTY